MNNRGSIGISVVILLTSFMLISITISPIITGGITGTSKENMEEILDDVFDAISTYLQIKDVMGKYHSTVGEQRIEKVVILIKPLLSQYNFELSSISSLSFPPLPLLNF
jgi:archaellin